MTSLTAEPAAGPMAAQEAGGAEASEPQADTSISVFLRVRPVPGPSPRITVDPVENEVEFKIPRQLAAGVVNNSREHYKFPFTGILPGEAKQDEVFERVARPIVSRALEGFNGTIFAYGQTGSGKTFTMTGGAERYVDRGIIPRSISTIYAELAKRADCRYQVHISYLEIYNEVGYDLLDPDREVKRMEDLPQVTIMEDDDQRIHFRNLSVHRANTEEEALNLLFLGDTNRTISETPMNQASSRSHCIFTLHLEARRPASDTVRLSKLNLVDLAGSERVAKTGLDGTVLREAKYINLSLHYLEQVIVALQERSMGLSRVHVPYRNSLMTQVLRDSLGGNCCTAMVATITAQQEQLEESISTCRFAQRVAMVQNQIYVNEEVDPKALIARLKSEIRDLKEELRLLRGGGPERGPLTPDELERLKQQVLAYCSDPAPESVLAVTADMMWIRAGFSILKQLVQDRSAAASSTSTSAQQQPGAPDCTPKPESGAGAPDQLRKLQLQVQQRDTEIGILVKMLQQQGPQPPMTGAAGPSLTSQASRSSATASQQQSPHQGSHPHQQQRQQEQGADAAPSTSGRGDAGGDGELLSALLDVNLLADRNKAFEVFRRSYRQNEVIEENKALLKAKYDQAKALGAAVTSSKHKVNELRAFVEHRRRQRSVAGVTEGLSPEEALAAPDPEEDRAKELMEQEKAAYKAAFSQMRGLKGEIEHLHLLLEQSRQRLQRDFQQWCTMVARQQQQRQGPGQVQVESQSGASRGDDGSLECRQPGSSSSSSNSVGEGVGAVQALQPAAAAAPQALGSSCSSCCVQELGERVGSIVLAEVERAVLEAARPHLTGNPVADEDIIRFYEARAKLLQKLGR